jgi:hypothetical protein
VALVFPRTPRPAARRLLDAAIILWAAAWIVVGLLVAREVRGLADLSRTVTAAGYALQEAGNTLGTLEGVPFVGEDVGDVAERTERAGRSARESGRSSRESVESLANLLGLSIALAPSLPLIALYLPMRLAWIREVRAVRRALAAAPDERGLDEYLARRAALSMPYDRLSATSADPWGDLAAGERRRLSDAELRRLGIRRPNGSVTARP